jgi:hypothetical protein
VAPVGAGAITNSLDGATQSDNDREQSKMNLIDFAAKAAGGLVTNDRGNGAGGPGYVTESAIYAARTGGEDDSINWDQPVNPVTEEEDADAWRLAREAYAAQGIAGEPEAVAVAVYSHRGGSNPYTQIVAR